jgi:hypothetical protein
VRLPMPRRLTGSCCSRWRPPLTLTIALSLYEGLERVQICFHLWPRFPFGPGLSAR